jgi:hypothetical protein
LTQKAGACAGLFVGAKLFIGHSRNKAGGTAFHQEHLKSRFVVRAGNANTPEEVFRMSNRFMVSVAALALIAGTGYANAQGGMKGGESSGSTMQHSQSSAPSKSDSSSGPARSESSESKSGMSKDEKGDMKSTQSEKSPGAMKNQSAQDKEKSGTTNQRAEDRAKGTETNQRAEDRAKGGDHDKNMKAEGRDSKSGTTAAETREKSGTNAAETRDKSGTNTNAAESKSSTTTTTTGQAGTRAQLTTEQRTKISSVIKSQHVESVNNVNFSVSVGTRVPRESIRVHTLPSEIVSIYPQWRGYDFIVVHEKIVIIDPNTYEIVEIIES